MAKTKEREENTMRRYTLVYGVMMKDDTDICEVVRIINKALDNSGIPALDGGMLLRCKELKGSKSVEEIVLLLKMRGFIDKAADIEPIIRELLDGA